MHSTLAFLEEVRKTRNDVFDLNADWNIRAMVFEYLAQGRLDEVDAAAWSLAESLEDVSEPFFSLMTTLRLAGRATAAEPLVNKAMRLLPKSKLMYWAVDELLGWAMFHAYQRCLAAGADDAAIEQMHDAARKMALSDSEQDRANRRDVMLHLSGQANKSWRKAELVSTKKTAYRNIYLLGVDFQRYLATECDVPPIAADELRSLVMEWINRVAQPFGGLLKGLVRREFEPLVAKKLDFMSLDRIHAPATIVAASRFYDFLKHVDLVNSGAWRRSQSVCEEIWDELRDGFKDEWASYEFLERYRRSPDTGEVCP